ncbi:MAG TPA: hypothetical protein VM689_10605 [Aliidongia sp.]|nr:hypothetical protein [Aliidongia sp.]
MRWITATQLENWARTLNARDELPKIVSDLIRASSPDVASIRFPSGDKGQVRGFDGHVVSNVMSFNVPQGHSLWEFGAGADYKDKARADFEKRTQQISVEDQRVITFIFVSPWTWDSSNSDNKLEDWIAARKASSFWKDVLYIDGVALETWLEHQPAVSAMHARKTLQLYPIDGIRSTDEFWTDFIGQFGPPITEEVLLCERESVALKLIQDLLQPSNVVSLVADSPDEVIAFAIAAIRKADPGIRLFLEARTLVVDSATAGRQLLAAGNLVLLLRNDATRSPGQFSKTGSSLVPLGRQQRGAGNTTLPKPTGYAMGVAMRTMGLEDNRARTLARGCGRSLAALARLIPGGSSSQPAWLVKGQDLLPAILAGAWDTSNSLDRAIVEQIAGGDSCSQLEAHLRGFLRDADPPFDLEGTIWRVRAPLDAFVRVGPLIGPREAELLRAAMSVVFAEIEPDVNPNEIVTFATPNPTRYSDWLREGLATTLLLLAVWSDPAEVNLGGESGQMFANRILNELPGLRTDPRLLTSLRNELPLLAEAAPDPLLSALEQMLEGGGDLIRPIFDEGEDWLYSTSHHTGLLWALETLAWDPNYFTRAVLILARLAAIDPGGRLSNRPANSLAEIFVLWNPNTNASPTQRLSALNEISKICPDVGWELILRLLPTLHGASSPTAKPKLREAGAADRSAVTYQELWDNQAIVSKRAIELAGVDLGRWIELVPRISMFAPSERSLAIAVLDEALSRLVRDERKILWVKIQDEIERHERFKGAAWALPESGLTPFRALAEKYAPSDPISSLVTMFNTWPPDESDYFADKQRAGAVKRLHEDGGAVTILQLAREARVPHLVAKAVSGADFSEAQVEELLTLSIDQDPKSSFTFGLSGLHRVLAGAQRAEMWLQRMSKQAASAQVIGELLQAWPDGLDTWSAVRRLGPEIAKAYWTQRSPRYLKGSRTELLRPLLMFLKYGRAIEAIRSSLDRAEEVPTKLILKMLEGVIPQLNARTASLDTMTNFYVEKMLQVLDVRSDVTDDQIATLEYQFLPLLEYGERKLRIHGLMASNPEFFHGVLKNVFLGKNEKRSEISPQAEANARLCYYLLSHFSLLPGRTEDAVDAAVLTAWVDEVRRLGAGSDRVEITDEYVGHVLAHAPADEDGGWPHRTVRDEIERLSSVGVERAIQIERFNMRGVHGQGLFDGGSQERDLARINYDAAKISAAWPRTSALLRAIGKMWEEDGKRADVDAAQRLLKS